MGTKTKFTALRFTYPRGMDCAEEAKKFKGRESFQVYSVRPNPENRYVVIHLWQEIPDNVIAGYSTYMNAEDRQFLRDLMEKGVQISIIPPAI